MGRLAEIGHVARIRRNVVEVHPGPCQFASKFGLLQPRLADIDASFVDVGLMLVEFGPSSPRLIGFGWRRPMFVRFAPKLAEPTRSWPTPTNRQLAATWVPSFRRVVAQRGDKRAPDADTANPLPKEASPIQRGSLTLPSAGCAAVGGGAPIVALATAPNPATLRQMRPISVHLQRLPRWLEPARPAGPWERQRASYAQARCIGQSWRGVGCCCARGVATTTRVSSGLPHKRRIAWKGGAHC